jgi:HEPN domain-containing protein
MTMNPFLLEATRQWFVKSDSDLRSARLLLTSGEPVLDAAAYHCQQAGKKALKGFLLFHGVEFPKIHDLGVLVSLATSIEPQFHLWFDAAEYLTPLATTFRYPGENMLPEPEELMVAYRHAVGLCEFIRSLLLPALS